MVLRQKTKPGDMIDLSNRAKVNSDNEWDWRWSEKSALNNLGNNEAMVDLIKALFDTKADMRFVDRQSPVTLKKRKVRAKEQGQKKYSKPCMKTFESDLRYYRDNLHTFLEQYNRKYIAIIGNNIVDIDADFSSLAKRIYMKFGYREIFMTRVEAPRTVNIPTPFLRRSRGK